MALYDTHISFRILKIHQTWGFDGTSMGLKKTKHMFAFFFFHGILREICPTIWHFDVWLKRIVTTTSIDFGWSKGDPKIWCKKTWTLWNIMEVFLVIYCDLVWFHENSWVYRSLHVNFDNRNITSQKNWVWCVSTNLKMARKQKPLQLWCLW